MAQGIEAAQNLPEEVLVSLSQIAGDLGLGLGKLAIIAPCAFGGPAASNANYDFAADARATCAFMQKTLPSASDLNATRSPPVDYGRVEQDTWDLSEAADESAIPALLSKGDQCLNAYDAVLSGSPFDQWVGQAIGLHSNATPRQIQAQAQQARDPFAIDSNMAA